MNTGRSALRIDSARRIRASGPADSRSSRARSPGPRAWSLADPVNADQVAAVPPVLAAAFAASPRSTGGAAHSGARTPAGQGQKNGPPGPPPGPHGPHPALTADLP